MEAIIITIEVLNDFEAEGKITSKQRFEILNEIFQRGEIELNDYFNAN